MSSLRSNIAANFGGSLWTGVMSLVFIPVYIRTMGIEPYGLVGFYLTMQSVLSLLDAGLSTTLNREFARLSLRDDSMPVMRRLLRTFESIYWIVAFVAGGLVLFAAPWIATRWVQPKQLAVGDVIQAVTLMGYAFMVQWPLSLYTGGMQGLQRQVRLNVINAAAATLRGVGAILVLWLVAPTVQTFFIWQIVVGLLHTAAVAVSLWRRIGGTDGATFDAPLLRTVWQFAAGMMGISVLSAALSQLDKMILSRVLSLSAFGYYSFAGAVAAGLYRIVTPIYSAVFPRFSQFVADNDERGLARLYHQVAQTIVVVVVPAAVFVAFFSYEVLLVWTGDPILADSTDGILALLILGTAVNGVLTIPYAVQLAYGWTRLVILLNIVAVIVLVPTVLLLSLRFGAPGAAFGWLAYNVAAAIVVPALMHARVLRGELFTWYLRDVGIPTAAAVLVAAVARALLPLRGDELFSVILRLGAVAFVVQSAALLGVARVRTVLINMFRSSVSVAP